MDLKIKNYLITIFGDPEIFKREIGKISEGLPKTISISNNSLVISTFQSTFDLEKVDSYIKDISYRSEVPFGFILIELYNDLMKVSISQKHQDFLFGDIFNVPTMDFNDLKITKIKEKLMKRTNPTVDELLDKMIDFGKDSLEPFELELLDKYSREMKGN